MCGHLGGIRDVSPRTDGCEDRLGIGGWWVHLRLCKTCGYVGSCDSSPNKHARKPAVTVGHPIIRSLQPGEDWLWCYDDEVFLEPAA